MLQTSDDQLRERMLIIEAQLRSLRSELEEKNLTSKKKTVFAEQNKPNNMIRCHESKETNAAPVSHLLISDKTDSENSLTSEGRSLFSDNICDLAAGDDMVNIF